MLLKGVVMFFELKITNILKSSGWGCHANRICYSGGVFPVELLAYQVSMVCTPYLRELDLYR